MSYPLPSPQLLNKVLEIFKPYRMSDQDEARHFPFNVKYAWRQIYDGLEILRREAEIIKKESGE
jgi:hypothetical protein